MMHYEEVMTTMQANCHLRHNPAGGAVQIAVFENNESVVPHVAKGYTDAPTFHQLVSDGLITKRVADGKSIPGFDWYDLTEKGRAYRP